MVHLSGCRSPLKKLHYKVGGVEWDKGRGGYSSAFLLVTVGGFTLYPVGGGLEILEDVSSSGGAMA